MILRISAIDFASLHKQLLRFAPAEGAAFLGVEPSGARLVVRSIRVFEACEYEDDTFELALTEKAELDALLALRQAGHGLVEAHTHPGSGDHVGFSSFDDEQLGQFAPYAQRKLRGRPFGALVLGERGYAGRAWVAKEAESLSLEIVGEHRRRPTWLSAASSGATVDPRFDRQIRALGPDGQAALAKLAVAVVGLGGTGSQVAQQVAHLGVGRISLVEDDRVETSNLHRLAGATWWDPLVRRKKAAVARRSIKRIAPRTVVTATGTLRSARSLEALRSVDLIIGCVDNDGARLVLSELAAAHLVPYLDIGVGVDDVSEGASQALGGRVSFQLPGGPCPACADEIDFGEAAEDLEHEGLHEMRVARGYARDRGVEPALMPLNTVLVGLAMMELLAFATGIRTVRPFLRYDGIEGVLVRSNVSVDPECPICRPASGMGDRQMIERYALRSSR